MAKRIFIDMDGTIADIHGEENWYERVKNEEDFFKKLNPFTNLIVALFLISLKYPKEEVELFSLSAIEKSFAKTAKDEWIAKEASFINESNRIYTKCGDRKADYVGPITKDDILLDDYSKNLIEWVEAGGTAIKVRNNINCSGKTWKGDTIYNQDSVSKIMQKLDLVIND